MIPTGNTTDVVTAYYNYLYTHYYAGIAVNRAEGLLWSSLFLILIWAVVLILSFFLMTYYMYRVHRGEGELYEATSFAGAILERNGKVSVFAWILSGGLFLSAVYLGIRFIILGYLY